MMKRLNLTACAALSVLFFTACGECGSADNTKQETPQTQQSAPAPAAAAQNSFNAVCEKARAAGKPVLLSFNGSDWCPWCIKLDQEVFAQKPFQDWVQENAVMYVADFPRSKQLDADTAKQNQLLVQKYNVEGFPTVVLIRADGTEIARTGYRPGGPEKYIEHLKELLKKL